MQRLHGEETAENAASDADKKTAISLEDCHNPDAVRKYAHGLPEKTWGDKIKHKSHLLISEFFVNYIINTALSIGATYGFKKYLSGAFQQLSRNTGKNLSKTLGMSEELAIRASEYGYTAALLTSGGNLLVVPLKYLKDNENRMEYRVGRSMDYLQVALGQDKTGDAQRRIDEEYERLDKYIDDVRHGRAPESGPPEDIVKIAAKHCIVFKPDGTHEYAEENKDWSDLFKARAFAIVAAIGANSALGATKGNLHDPAIIQKYGKYGKGFGELETAIVPKVNRVISKMPGLWRLNAKDSEMLSHITFNDAILTGISAVSFGWLDRVLEEKKNGQAKSAPEKDHGKPEPVADGSSPSHSKHKGDNLPQTLVSSVESVTKDGAHQPHLSS